MKDELFKRSYRTTSLRLEGFDYGSDGAYLITLCSYERQRIFSEVKDGEVCLSILGKIIQHELEMTNKIRKYVTVTEWIIMPDHIHMILFIHKNSDEPAHLSPKGSDLYFPDGYRNKFGPQSENLASIIRGIKSAVTQKAKIGSLVTPIWQRNYYEHIIRNEIELNKLVQYIRENPFVLEDGVYPENM